MSENTTLLTVLVSTGILTALAQLLVATAGYIKGKTDRAEISRKVDAVVAVNVTQNDKLDDLKVATDGLVEKAVASGDAVGFNRGVAQERAVAKDLLASGDKQ